MGGNFDGKCVPEERVECKPKHTRFSLLHVRASMHDKLIVRSARLDLIGSNSFYTMHHQKLMILRAAHTAGPIVAAGCAFIYYLISRIKG